jgi:hypothetical protein
MVRMPYKPDNRAWLHEQLGDYIRPEWNKVAGHWEIARPHMRAVVEALADRFGIVEVIIDSRVVSRCDTQCQNATGDECDCECMGENHGGTGYWRSWIEVGETTLLEAGFARRVFHVTRRA